LIEQLQKAAPLSIIPEYILLFIASARDMINGVWVVHAERPGVSHFRMVIDKTKEVTPIDFRA